MASNSLSAGSTGSDTGSSAKASHHSFPGDESSVRQEFICLVQDISGYFKAVKNMGTASYDISRESAGIMEDWNTLHRSVSGKEPSAMVDRRALKKLALLSLQGCGDSHSSLFFIICNKKISNETQGKEKSPGVYQGDAGELFLKILKAMKLDQNSVYTSCITLPDQTGKKREISMEMDASMDFIKKQIYHVCPEIICCLGDIAVRAFLGPDHSLSVSRGRFYDYKGIKVMPTFHPASLLMDPSKKKYVWDDMQKIMAMLGISYAT